MIIIGALSGIQDYLFNVQETGGGQAKSLRYRSFRIQLMAEAIAVRLLDRLDLPKDALLYTAAARFAIRVEEVQHDTIRVINEETMDIQAWIMNHTHGRLRLSIASSDHHSTTEAYQQASKQLRVEKYRPWSHLIQNTHPDSSVLIHDSCWSQKDEAKRDEEYGRQIATGHSNWLLMEPNTKECKNTAMDCVGLRVRFSDQLPSNGSPLLSCSNLSDPDHTPPESLPTYRRRYLARHIPTKPNGQPFEFVELAGLSNGAPMLGVLKADVDSLGSTIGDILKNRNDLSSIQELSERLNRFFAHTMSQEMHSSKWNDLYTVFAGGDDLLLVGPWNTTIDFAWHLRGLFDKEFGSNSPSGLGLTLSASISIIKPKYPVRLGSKQAEDLLEQAKTECAVRSEIPKDQLAVLGGLWKWQDHAEIVKQAKQLQQWVNDNDKIIQRGWLNTLLELTQLRRRETPSRRSDVIPEMATSKLAYHVARIWPKKNNKPRNNKERQGHLARTWINEIIENFDRSNDQVNAQAANLSSILRYAILATRSGHKENSHE